MHMHVYMYIYIFVPGCIKKFVLGDFHIVGPTTPVQPTPEVAHLLQHSRKVAAFYKLITANGTLLYSMNYSRVKSRNSYTISFFGTSDTLFGDLLCKMENQCSCRCIRIYYKCIFHLPIMS